MKIGTGLVCHRRPPLVCFRHPPSFSGRLAATVSAFGGAISHRPGAFPTGIVAIGVLFGGPLVTLTRNFVGEILT